MSKTNKGGTRLRVITGLTAAMAIAAGVLAAHLHKTTTFTCYFDNDASGTTRLAVKAGNDLLLRCPGANALATYDLTLNNSGWASSTTANIAGADLQGAGVTLHTDSTIGSSVSNANVSVTIQGAGDNGQSINLQILKLSYTGSPTDVLGGNPARMQAAGLISMSTYNLQPYIGSSFDNTGWETTGTGNSSGSDASNLAPMPTSSSNYTSAYLSGSSIDTYIRTKGSGPAFDNNVSVKLFDSNKNLIDAFPTLRLHKS